jgi:hypothetical protein
MDQPIKPTLLKLNPKKRSIINTTEVTEARSTICSAETNPIVFDIDMALPREIKKLARLAPIQIGIALPPSRGMSVSRHNKNNMRMAANADLVLSILLNCHSAKMPPSVKDRGGRQTDVRTSILTIVRASCWHI